LIEVMKSEVFLLIVWASDGQDFLHECDIGN